MINSYISDTTQFITMLEDLITIPVPSWLVNLDVKSMYINTVNIHGLDAAKET